MQFDCRKSIKYVINENQTENDREIDKKNSASNASKFLRTYIDAKSADSNFFDLTKICQRIRSINMRKDQIFSVFFDRVLVFRIFVFFDRVFALQGRAVITA